MRPEAIVIGGSAGSLGALSIILGSLPAQYPVPILAVVHIPPEKENILPEVLQVKCRIQVCEAMDKLPIKTGTAYFAPPDYHLLVEHDRSLSLFYDEARLFSRPSIDVLFESAADVYGPELIGVVLSGANADGAEGLKRVVDEGGLGIVQDPANAYAAEMPSAALQRCPTARSLGVDQIAEFLNSFADL